MAEQSKTHAKVAQTLPELTVARLERVDLIIRQSHEQNTIIIRKLHAVQVEVQELRSEVSTLLRAVRFALEHSHEDPLIREALMKDTQKHASHAYTKPI